MEGCNAGVGVVRILLIYQIGRKRWTEFDTFVVKSASLKPRREKESERNLWRNEIDKAETATLEWKSSALV
tara:strand:- start:8579 stop:8791 length:213 start_codon:yes stop_codon:yes gene_type:complete